jgi:hypothetical protein
MNEVMQMAGVVEKKTETEEVKDEGSWLGWGILGGMLVGWFVLR